MESSRCDGYYRDDLGRTSSSISDAKSPPPLHPPKLQRKAKAQANVQNVLHNEKLAPGPARTTGQSVIERPSMPTHGAVRETASQKAIQEWLESDPGADLRVRPGRRGGEEFDE